MHFGEDNILEMSREGSKLTARERLHLEQCEECGDLFRMFVLHRFYSQRELEQSLMGLTTR